MRQAPLPPELRAGAAALAARFDTAFANLLHCIAASFRDIGPLTNPAWSRISRTHQRLVRLLANLAAGRLPRLRAPRPAAARPSHVPPRKGGPPAPFLPHRRGWLGHVAGYQLRNVASQLRHALHHPETQATLAAAPPHIRKSIARTLSTACRLLDITLPPLLLPPPAPPIPKPARPKPERPARAKPAPLPPMRPIYPQRRPRDLPFLRPPPAARPA